MNGKQTNQAFVKESQKLLWDMEDALLHIEGGGGEEELKTIFQSVHALRETAAFFGCVDVMSFAHTVENLVGNIRDLGLKPAGKLIANLYLCCDLLRGLINHLAHNAAGAPDVGIGDIIKSFISVDVPAMSRWMLADGETSAGLRQTAR